MKKQYDVIFVVLIYKNYNDLIDFVTSVKNTVKSYKIIVVNSFFDVESEKQINSIALSLNCDYINIDNKGYSYGNNVGIDYANKNYNFNYLIISNPDIILKTFDYSLLLSDCVMGPTILSNRNSNQNPYRVKDYNFLEKITFYSYKKNNKYLLFFIAMFYKIYREIYLIFIDIFKMKLTKVDSLHGAFIIFPRKVLEKLNYKPFFDEMFLFNEELYLTYLCKCNNIDLKFIRQIKILHKEDGSLSLSDVNISGENKKSFFIFYKYKNKK